MKEIEEKWRSAWERANLFASKPSGKKFYCLEMFPYPSGKLHMGHVRNYCIGDCIARFKRMQGFSVLYTMGYDALGLPAENAAIESGVAPDEWTENNINDMRITLKKLSLSYDWSRELMTCDPEYYKWEQLFFLRFFKNGLAYKKKAKVNYCNKCKTVLANEQVHDGRCWRCGTEIVEKELEQWFFRITKYAEELLNDLEQLDWPERVKIMQRNWIGKSRGAEILFHVKDSNTTINVFTTRADTLFGCTFLAISPEHELVNEVIKPQHRKIVEDFLNQIKGKTLAERAEHGKEGVFTGSYAINPVNNEEIPIYIAEYVLTEYGTGAIMCVPSHDQRDFEFAIANNLPIRVVVKGEDEVKDRAYEGEGILINSQQFDGLSSSDARIEITKYLKNKKLAEFKTNYKLRDWLISRQRYWGVPIPIIYCRKCGIVPVPEEDLPVELPPVSKVKFGKGNPLETCDEFVNTKCPNCGGYAKRETDTMDTFVDSSWYFLRYCSPNGKPFNAEIDFWMPVDFYVGGIEHAIMHLIYARFFTKALRDLGFVKVGEPFSQLLCQGMVLKDGSAMSKSKGNIVGCDDMLEKYGADTIRLFELSSALPESDIEFTENGINGSYKFLTKLYNLTKPEHKESENIIIEAYLLNEKELLIKNVTKELEDMRFNLAIAEIFSFVDRFSRYRKFISRKTAEKISNTLALLLAPITPHIAEEIWHMNNNTFVSLEKWPKLKEIDKKAIESGELIEKTIDDIKNIIKIVEKAKMKRAEKVYIYPIPDEVEIFSSGREIIEEGLGLQIFIQSSKNPKHDPENKAKKSKKGKPGIYLE